MAIKKKVLRSANATLPTLPTLIPPLFTNVIATPFASGSQYKNPLNVLTNPNPLRPTQVNGFDISVTQLRVPNPVYLNDLNGIFNLYSGILSDIFGGSVVQFEQRYIDNQATAGVPLLNRGYRIGAILFDSNTLAWYQSVVDYNKNSPATTPSAWQKITDVSANLVQQGRLTGVSGSPYGDTDSSGSGNSTLYFTPTYDGNLISLYDGISKWITQSFTELALPVGTLIDSPNAIGSLSSIGNVATGDTPNGIIISPNGNNVYVLNYNQDTTISSIYQYSRSAGLLTAIGTAVSTGLAPNGIIISPDGLNVYVTNAGDNNVSQYSRDAGGILTSIGTPVPIANIGMISISPDGNFVYATGNNSLSQYRRNGTGTSGTLTFVRFLTTAEVPSVISISPNGLNVYIINSTTTANQTVSQFSRNISTGILTEIGTPVTAGSFTEQIVISPDGNNVYVTNRGDNTVSQYSRNSDGTLTSLGTVVTQTQPQGITISPTGNNAYVTNANSNTVSVYSRSAGLLTAIDTTNTQSSPRGITISPDGANVYVANYLSSTVSEYSRTTTPPPPPLAETSYDIFVGNDTLNVLTLARDTFTNGTVTNRTQQNGRWVNANGVTTPTGTTIPSKQGLLVGSITVANDSTRLIGKVQSWYGNRSIWNLYNQVSKVLQAYTNTTIAPPDTTWILQGNGVAGQDIFYFIVDKLYKQQSIRFYYDAIVKLGGTNTDNCSMGITNNTTSVIVPLSSADLSGLSGTAASKPTGNINFSYNLSVVNTLGFQYIQKITRKYNSGTYYPPTENQGLTAEFWG